MKKKMDETTFGGGCCSLVFLFVSPTLLVRYTLCCEPQFTISADQTANSAFITKKGPLSSSHSVFIFGQREKKKKTKLRAQFPCPLCRLLVSHVFIRFDFPNLLSSAHRHTVAKSIGSLPTFIICSRKTMNLTLAQ